LDSDDEIEIEFEPESALGDGNGYEDDDVEDEFTDLSAFDVPDF
jgi:hypothetical protein